MKALILKLAMVSTLGAVLFAHPVFAANDYPDDDTDDAFVGQDELFKNKNPFHLMYLGAYVGAAEVTVKSYGKFVATFDTGFRFAPEWSAGIFASLMPEEQTLLSREPASLFGIEGDYHFDRWIKNFYAGVLMGFLDVENTANFGIGTKAGYDYQITNFFWLSAQINMFLNTQPKEGGHAFQALIGVKFQRGKK